MRVTQNLFFDSIRFHLRRSSRTLLDAQELVATQKRINRISDDPINAPRLLDIKRAKDALKNDPFFMRHPPWQKAFKDMIQMGVRVEQQAFAKHGLNFVIEEYLPRKLKRPDLFLP